MALSYFDSSSVADGTSVNSLLNLSGIVTAVQSLGSDTYFDSTDEIGRTIVYYTQIDGRQKKRVVHDVTSHTGTANWTSIARDGAWQKTRVRVYDHDGAFVNIPRSVIGTGEDCTHSSGQTILNTL